MIVGGVTGRLNNRSCRGKSLRPPLSQEKRPADFLQRQCPKIDNNNDITYNIIMRIAKLFELAGKNPAGIRFLDLCKLAEAFGFVFQHQKGSHRVYAQDGIRQIMNFQNDHGMAKAYQVKQLMSCINKHRLTLEE